MDGEMTPGLCYCGCGGKTSMVYANVEGYRKGEYRKFLRGHSTPKKYFTIEEKRQAKREREAARWRRNRKNPAWRESHNASKRKQRQAMA